MLLDSIVSSLPFESPPVAQTTTGSAFRRTRPPFRGPFCRVVHCQAVAPAGDVRRLLFLILFESVQLKPHAEPAQHLNGQGFARFQQGCVDRMLVFVVVGPKIIL